MTRLRTSLYLALIATCAALSAHILTPGHPGEPAGEEPEAIGESENPAARAEWEHLRLRDPATGRIPEGIRARELAYAATLPRRSMAMMKGAGMQEYSWNHRGPFNIGGRTRALAVDVTGEDTILAGGTSGGMWRSTDRGRTWSKTTLPGQLPSVTCITQDTRPGHSAIWYYGTGELLGSSASEAYAYYQGNGLFKSTDNGRSWAPLAATASNKPHLFDRPSDFVWSVAVDPSNTAQDEVYAAYYGVISRSTNGGTTWTDVLRGSGMAGNYQGPYTDVTVTREGVVYGAIGGGGVNRGIWRTVDGASGTWKKITPDSFPADPERIVLGLAPSNPNVLYVLAETPGRGFLGRNFRGDSSWQSLWKYTYLSGDGTGSGGRWEDRSMNLPAFGGGSGDFFSQGGYDLHVHAKPDDENVLFIGGTNLYRSDDAFATKTKTAWIGGYKNFDRDTLVINDYSYPEHHPDQHTLVFSPRDPRVVYTGSDGGIHRSPDATAATVAWESLNGGYLTTQFYSIAIDHATPGDPTMMGGLQDNGTWMSATANGAAPWTLRGTSDGAFVAIADGRSAYYVSNQFGYLFRVRLDGQGNMISSTRVDPEGGTGYLFTNPFTLDPANQNMMFLAGGVDLWRNSDLSAIPASPNRSTSVNWTRLAGAKVSDSTKISALAVTAAAPLHRVYYGTENGRVFRLDGADAGDPQKIEITGGSFPKDGYVTCISVDPLDGNRAVVVFSNYSVQSLFLTTDAGETWTPIGGNLEPNATTGSGAGPSCRWFSFLHRGTTTLYMVATSTGLYSTMRLDGTSTQWTQEGSETIGNMVVDMIDARQSDGFVAVATHGNGVYTTSIGTLGVDREGSSDGTVAGNAGKMLEGNYPDPVGARTTIRFTLPASMPIGRVRLRLFDPAGREVATLLDRVLGPGAQSVEVVPDRLGAGGMAAGVYYYRLETPVGDESRRMRILR